MINKSHIKSYIDQRQRCKVSGLLNSFPELNQLFDATPTAQQIWDYIYDVEHPPVCPQCGKEVKFVGLKDGYRVFCSTACGAKSHLSKEKAIQSSMAKYGVPSPNQCPEIQKKQQTTLMAHYGVPTNFLRKDVQERATKSLTENKEAIQEKIKQTSLERYGVPSPNQCPEIQKKQQDSLLLRYGVTTNFKRPEIREKAAIVASQNRKTIREKIKQTSLERYGVESPNQCPEIQKKQQQSALPYKYGIVKQRYQGIFDLLFSEEEFNGLVNQVYDVRCCICGKISTVSLQGYSRCSCMRYRSKDEQEICSFLGTIGIVYECNTKKVIYPYEIDIYIPELKVAIEYCGLYWHSETAGRDKSYHEKKMKLCNEKGIRLITIFSDEWINKPEICKQRLAHILGKGQRICSGRQTVIRDITTMEYQEFINQYHIQGYVGASIKLGAWYGDELVAVMSFGKRRKALGGKATPNDWELLRFATKGAIPGIASKLYRHFKSQYSPGTVLSYCDLRWGTGDLYRNLGFRETHSSPPNYWYIANGYSKREHRYAYRKDVLVKEGYDPSKTEWGIMRDRGFDRIWDCGCLVFVD